ncbi:unnamed protein product, partial [marine sediment metagenome]
IGQITSEIHSSGDIDYYFLEDSKSQLLKRISRTKIYKHLKNLSNVAINIRRAFFQVLNTPEKVDEKWDSFLAPTMKNAAEYF